MGTESPAPNSPDQTTPESSPTPQSPDAPLGWDGKAFDPERARRTLQAVQEDARKAKADLAAYKLAQDRAKLDEVERLKAEMADLQAKALEAEESAATERNRTAITRQAARLGFTDPEDAYRLIDLAEAGDDIEGALKRLAEAKPYLTKSTGSTGQHKDGSSGATVTTSAANHASGGKRLTLAEIEKMTPAERQTRREEVRDFLRTFKR